MIGIREGNLFNQIFVRQIPPLVNSGAMKTFSLLAFLSWSPLKLCTFFPDMETTKIYSFMIILLSVHTVVKLFLMLLVSWTWVALVC